ncbi:hypothetical protein Taro_024572, partial [Colocasia esculenta]|nr:hypothetical protein [Colocasia esculenta]
SRYQLCLLCFDRGDQLRARHALLLLLPLLLLASPPPSYHLQPCCACYPMQSPATPLTSKPTPTHLFSFSSHFSRSFPLRLSRSPFPPISSSSKPLSLQVICCKAAPTTRSLLSFLLRGIPDWSDDVKERGMRRRRPLYNHSSWRKHRSSRRHLRHLLSILSSRVILSLIPPVFALTAAAAAVAAYNSVVAAGWVPELFPLLRASSLPYQLAAPALALLLVFRTEASYSRYQEGRNAWMKVMAGTSDLAGMVMSVDAGELSVDVGTKRALLNYIMAFPVALKCHVIYGSDITADLCNLLEEDDLAVVLKSKHRPRCILEFISWSIQMLQMEEAKKCSMESKMSCFHEGICVCEQLMGIPIPLSYTRLTSRLLVLWHLTLPIILWDDCHWIVVPATFVSAASLFGIEEVGVLIEEPFSVLALDELCDQLLGSIQETLAIHNLVQEQVLARRKSQMDGHSANGRPN